MKKFWTFFPSSICLIQFAILQIESSIQNSNINVPNPDYKLWTTRNEKISSLFSFFCLRNQDQTDAASSGFEPLNYLSLYSNPETVSTFVGKIKAGKTHPKWGRYLSGEERQDTIPIFDVLYFVNVSTTEGWDLFYNTTAYFSLKTNVRQFIMAMELISATKFFGLITIPPLSTSIPQFFSPKQKVWRINGLNDKEGGGELGFDSGYNVEPLYWRFDQGYREFHFAWNMDLPPDLDQAKYGLRFDRKGELFLYSHHYMEVRYFAERRSQGLGDIEALSLNTTFRVKKGYEPFFLNGDFSEFPIRGPDSSLTTQEGFDNLTKWEGLILNAFKEGYAVNKSGERFPFHKNPETEDSDIFGTEIFGALFQATTASTNRNYYGNLHESLHVNLATLRDPKDPNKLPKNVMGLMDHAESSLTDSAFYQLHLYVDNLYKRHKYASPTPRNEQHLTFSGIELRDVNLEYKKGSLNYDTTIPILTTFFEEYTYDISNVVMDCDRLKSGEKFEILNHRLNYNEFDYKIRIFSSHSANQDAIVRIFMGPYIAANGQPYPVDDLFWNMIEMDKFPIRIKPGENQITRSSMESSIVKKNSVTPGDLRRTCGWPSNLLLPKGTSEGLLMKLFVIVTPAKDVDGVKLVVENEKLYPTFSLCGHPYLTLPDDKPLGYPFDKRLILENPFARDVFRNFGFYDVAIKHLG